jgi:hypothetical protein
MLKLKFIARVICIVAYIYPPLGLRILCMHAAATLYHMLDAFLSVQVFLLGTPVLFLIFS